MELKGKIISFLGDSITEGNGVTDRPYSRFQNIIERECELGGRHDYGIGGTRIARQTVPTNPTYDMDFCMRSEKIAPDSDIIFVLGGINDYSTGDAPLGEFGDRIPYTFYGALHTLYLTLINNHPNAQKVVATPLHRAGDNRPNSRGLNLDDYVKAIKEVAEYYAIPVCDLHAISGIQPDVPLIREMYCPDSLHPNDAGHRLLADKIIGFLKAL